MGLRNWCVNFKNIIQQKYKLYLVYKTPTFTRLARGHGR